MDVYYLIQVYPLSFIAGYNCCIDFLKNGSAFRFEFMW